MTNIPRPSHLTPENAAAFQLAGVVDAYHLRTPYPSSLAPCLVQLMRPAGGKILELGCGTGEIARALAAHAERVDAIDISAPMLEKATTLPGGTDSRIRWILGSAEAVALDPPYALAVADDALHWMNWETVLPRLRQVLAPGAVLAIVTAEHYTHAWASELQEAYARYSTMRNFERYTIVDELVKRRLFEPLGHETVGPEAFSRSVDEYIEGMHAMAGLTRERMGSVAAREFDETVRALVSPFATDGVLELAGSAHVVWGTPSA